MGDGHYEQQRGHVHDIGSLCFFGFFRSAIPSESGFEEGAHLTFVDVTVDSTEETKMLRVRVKASKMDLFWEGVDVGKTDNELCPVTA